MLLDLLRRLLEWRVGAESGWTVSAGSAGRYLSRRLPRELWERVEACFVGGGVEENWAALFGACDLVREVGQGLATRLG